MLNFMALFRVICLLMLFFIFYTQGDISDKRLCADPNCSKVISRATVMLRYISSDHRMPSLKLGETVHVYSKSAGSRMDLWGIEVNGVRGYVPKDFVRESKVFIRTEELKYTLPTEKEEAPAFVAGVSADSVPESTLSREGITSPMEVIDGTTLFLSPDGDVAESKPIQATAVNTNIQPTATPQQTSIGIDDTTQPTVKAGLSEPGASSQDDLKQGSNVIETSDKPPSSESEGITDSILNFASGFFEGKDDGGAQVEQTEDELEEGSGDEEEEEEEVEDEEEDEEDYDDEDDDMSEDEEVSEVLDNTETHPSQAPSSADSNGGKIKPLSDTAQLGLENPPESGNGTEIYTSQTTQVPDVGEKRTKSDIATNEAASVSNETLFEEANETIANDTADASDSLSAMPISQSGAEQKSKITVSDIKSLPPLVLQRLPDATKTSDDTGSDQKVALINGVLDKSPTEDVGSIDLNYKEDGLDNAANHHETQKMIPEVKETEHTEEKINVMQPHSAIQQAAENLKMTEDSDSEKPNIADENISPDTMQVLGQSANVDAGYEEPLNQDLHSVKEDKNPETSSEQLGERQEENLNEPSQVTDLLNEKQVIETEPKDIFDNSGKVIFQANTTQIEEEQLLNETENITEFNDKGIEGQPVHGQLEEITNESQEDVNSEDTVKPVKQILEEQEVKETEHTEEKINVTQPHSAIQQTDENLKMTEGSDSEKPNIADENISPESMQLMGQSAKPPSSESEGITDSILNFASGFFEGKDDDGAQGEQSEDELEEGSGDVNNVKESLNQDLEIVRKLESGEDSISVSVEHKEKLENTEFLENVSLGSKNLESNIGQGEDQQAKEQHKEHAPVFLNEEYVTTESNSDGSYDDTLYVEDTVTEAYTDVQENVTEIPSVMEESTDIPVNEENDKQTNTDSLSELSDEGQTESIFSEKPVDLVSKVTSSVFAVYESLSEMILGPRIIEQVADDGASKKASFEKSQDDHEGHKEGDHLVSTFDKESSAVCDSECEARKLGPDPVVDHTLLSTKQESSHYEYIIMEDQKDPLYTKFFLSVTAVTVLLFTLGYYYIEKKQRDGTLLAKINRLEKALLASAKEKSNLQVDLEETKEKLTSVSNTSCSGDIISSLESELEEAKTARIELEEQVASLEKELDTATETGLELNRMLSEFLSAQHGSDSLMKSVEQLQKQLDSQQGTINSMNSSLSAKSLENESLQADLNLAEERIKALEEEIQKVSQALLNMEKEKQEMEHEFQQKNKSIETQLVEALEGKSAEFQRLGRELEALQEVLDETRRTLASRDGELEVLRDCLRKADDGSGDSANVKLEELANVGRARAELALITREKDSLLEKLQGEEEARKLLEDHVRIVSEEVDSLRVKYREAEHAKVEAQTRLEVLSTYFKEKETQLQKELGLQEAMYIQKEGDAMSTIERIKSLQEEVESYNGVLDIDSGLDVTTDSFVDSMFNDICANNNIDSSVEVDIDICSSIVDADIDSDSLHDDENSSNKRKKKVKAKSLRQNNGSQNETLKKEILDQERGLKAQIATLERKAHENWVVARQAERKLEETKQENGQLRNRLTLVERNILNTSEASPKLNDRHHIESNGEHPTSPLPMVLADLQDLPGSPLHYGHPASPPLLPPPGQPMPLPPVPFPPGLFMPPPPHGLAFMTPLPPGDRRPPPLGRMSSPPPSPYDRTPPPSPPGRPYRSPPPRYDDSPDRYRHRATPPRRTPPPPYPPYPGVWDDHHGPPRSGFRPLRRESPREPKGSTLSSGHSSESIDKSSRHSGRV